MAARCGLAAASGSGGGGSSSRRNTSARPRCSLSISLWDMDAGTVLRADVCAEAVTEKGFDMVFRTWGDTRVARVRIAWTAFGELQDADIWDVS